MELVVSMIESRKTKLKQGIEDIEDEITTKEAQVVDLRRILKENEKQVKDCDSAIRSLKNEFYTEQGG